MKYLTFSVNGTPLPLPNSITSVNNAAGSFGVNVFKLAVNLLIFGAIISVLFFTFWGGFKWMTSQGDKKKIEDARNTIIWSIVGLFVVFFAFLVINVIGGFLKIPILTLKQP